MTKKIRYVFYVIGIILIIIGTVYAYLKIQPLPNRVPLQTGDGGAITTYGSKYWIYLIPACMVVCLLLPLLHKIPFRKGGYHLSTLVKEKGEVAYVDKNVASNVLVGVGTLAMILFLVFEPFCIHVMYL